MVLISIYWGLIRFFCFYAPQIKMVGTEENKAKQQLLRKTRTYIEENRLISANQGQFSETFFYQL